MIKPINFLLISFLYCCSIASATSTDSIGLKIENGKTFVVHAVDSSETLYSISVYYDATLTSIMEANQMEGDWRINIGQELFIPIGKPIKKMEEIRLPTKSSDGYKIHYVDKGQTLYAISKMYGTNTSALTRLNPELVDYNVKPGQAIKIPKVELQPTNQARITKGAKIHQVSQGETLYSISRLYGGVDLNNLRIWNGLIDNQISDGQLLIIGWKHDATPVKRLSPIDQESVAVIDFSPELVERGTSHPEDEGTVTITSFTEEPIEIINLDRRSSFQKIFDQYTLNDRLTSKHKGIATWLKEKSNSQSERNYYALHNIAPVGTIISVKNLMNNRVIYAKVIGDIPKNKADHKSIVKLSYEAARYLNGLDTRFLVEVNYLETKTNE